MQDICGFIVTLSNEDQDQLFRYLISEEQQDDICHFKSVLQVFQEFLSKKLQTRVGSSGNAYPDPSVVDATKCISILCKFMQINFM